MSYSGTDEYKLPFFRNYTRPMYFLDIIYIYSYIYTIINDLKVHLLVNISILLTLLYMFTVFLITIFH